MKMEAKYQARATSQFILNPTFAAQVTRMMCGIELSSPGQDGKYETYHSLISMSDQRTEGQQVLSSVSQLTKY